jgi:NDP-sugar pyrophosphorylase family protein
MKVDYALVLAAGKGTRMGNIGKDLPKVIWPVFEKTILELETLYCKDFGAKKVFVNLFNYKDKILNFLKDRNLDESVNIIIEQEPLDIGGAIHNLASQLNYKGKLLVINSDQFIMLSEDIKKRFYDSSNDHDVVILTYDVEGHEQYNGVESIENKVIGIKKNSEYERDEKFETYTGMSIINLEALTPISGTSKFFESVANFKKLNVGKINIKNSTYWDFGTTTRYFKSMFSILNCYNQNDSFINFLKKYKSINEEKISKDSYGTSVSKAIDLANNKDVKENSIYLTKSFQKIPDSPCIVSGENIEVINSLQ